MREIKFRAWDGKQIYKQPKIPFDYINLGIKESGLVFMQYTGHTDIEGKEVYDGDLLKFPADSSEHAYQVKWLEDEGCWGVMFSDNTQMGKIGMTQFMHVIGNIYESPELLPNGKDE